MAGDLATQDIRHDRGLGTAYERYCFYQLLDSWARRYAVTSMLEGPVDGMAGVSGVHGAVLARQGIKVSSFVPTPEKAATARAVYEATGGSAHAEVRVVAGAVQDADLPTSDLVLAYHSFSLVADWRTYLQALARLTRRVLVVAVCNPQNWGVELVRLAARLRGAGSLEAPAVWHTETLAPALWAVGRVREHVYFDCPWWPDLQVSAGQSLRDRVGQLARQKRSQVRFTAEAADAKLAERFVYGPERWPYFGGPGWGDELLPALLRHPGFDGSTSRLTPRIAHLHAFVVDVGDRTPQARHRLKRQ